MTLKLLLKQFLSKWCRDRHNGLRCLCDLCKLCERNSWWLRRPRRSFHLRGASTCFCPSISGPPTQHDEGFVPFSTCIVCAGTGDTQGATSWPRLALCGTHFSLLHWLRLHHCVFLHRFRRASSLSLVCCLSSGIYRVSCIQSFFFFLFLFACRFAKGRGLTFTFARVLVRAHVDGPSSQPSDAEDHTLRAARALVPPLALLPPQACHRQRAWAVSVGSHIQQDMDIS